MSRAVIPESSYPHPVREKKRAAVLAVRLGGGAAVCSAALAMLAWAGCLPDLTPIPPVEAGIDAGEVLPSSYCGDGIIATLDDGGDAGESCDPADAAVLGCRNCKIECEDKLDEATGHCYFALPTKYVQYGQAVTACRAANAHVVTLGSASEIDRATALAAGTPYWVGLAFDNVVPGFQSASSLEPGFPKESTSGPCEGCFGVGTDGGFIPPQDASSTNANCVVARSASSWVAQECIGTEPLTAICEREPEGVRTTSCIGGFCFNVLSTAGKKTYLLGVDSLSASEANATCRSLDGRLAVLETVEEREQIARELILRYPTDQETTYWIGVSTDDAGTWTWDDGVVVADGGARRSPWGDKQPTTPSVDASTPARAFMRIASIYDVSLAYGDTDPTSRRRYLCERTPK